MGSEDLSKKMQNGLRQLDVTKYSPQDAEVHNSSTGPKGCVRVVFCNLPEKYIRKQEKSYFTFTEYSQDKSEKKSRKFLLNCNGGNEIEIFTGTTGDWEFKNQVQK